LEACEDDQRIGVNICLSKSST